MTKVPAKPFLTLAISHEIYLTRDDRYRLAAGDSIGVTGVSVPVWYAKSKTNEPASEIFCVYVIHNSRHAAEQVYFREDGYEFNLPQLPADYAPPAKVDDAAYLAMTAEERSRIAPGDEAPPCGADLKDIRDGGSARLAFSVTSRAKMRGITTLVYHTVRISDIDVLTASLI